MFTEIDDMKGVIKDTMGQLGDTLQKAAEKGGTGWLNDEQQSEVFDYGTKLRRLK